MVSTMALTLQDTQADAVSGTLGRSESGVQDLFKRLDILVGEVAGSIDRHANRRGGEWMGRSYKLDGKLLLRVDPKVAGRTSSRTGSSSDRKMPKKDWPTS